MSTVPARTNPTPVAIQDVALKPVLAVAVSAGA
jgi:hypothetical protein